MFKLLRKLFGNLKRKMNNSAQIAIIIILIIAIALVFYAVALNLGQISTNKAYVTMASNVGAAMLGSEMASYGQYLFETQLDGKEHLCAGTNVLLMVLTLLVILIICIIAAPFTSGGSLGGFIAAMEYFLVAIVLIAASAIIQAVIIDPMITAMWNEQMQENLSQVDQFVEKGINAGLGAIVSDQQKVIDFYDFDQDLIWGMDEVTQDTYDHMARYAVYYTRRLNNIPKTESDAVENFFKALAEFIYDDPFHYKTDSDPLTVPDDWGLYDPVGSNFGCPGDYDSPLEMPSVCNPCCMPKEITNPLETTETMPIRDELCDCADAGTCLPDEEPGKSLNGYCSQNSMYPDSDTEAGGEGYRYIYDAFFENPENKFASFIEQIGKDDEVENYYKNKADINHAQFRSPTTPPPLSGSYTNVDKFRIQDTTGYYFKHSSFEPPTHRLIYKVDYQAFTNCLNECSDKNCAFEVDGTGAKNGPLPVEPVKYYDATLGMDIGYDYAGVPAFDETQDCTVVDDESTLNDSRGWRSVIIANRNRVIPPDGRPGIFPLLYKLRDWGLDLTKHGLPTSPTTHPEYCAWYDNQYDSGAPVCPADLSYPLPEQLRLDPLDLPLDPADPLSEIVMNTTVFVDGKNIDIPAEGRAYLAVDRVHIRFNRDDPATVEDESEYVQEPIIADDDECSQEALDRAVKSEGGSISDQYGFWKAGSDWFCAPEDDAPAIDNDDSGEYHWTYDYECDTNNDGTVDAGDKCTYTDTTYDPTDGDSPIDPTDPYSKGTCECSQNTANAATYYTDVLDDMVYGMRYFIDFFQILLARSTESNIRDFKVWYSQAAPWIEPGTAAPWEGHSAIKDVDAKPPCFVCEEEDGTLWYWYRQIRELKYRFKQLLDGPYVGEADADDTRCDQVWCGPPMSAGECFEPAPTNCVKDPSTLGCGWPYKYNWPSSCPVAEDCKYIWDDERSSMNRDGDAQYNEMEDVMSCLDHNIARVQLGSLAGLLIASDFASLPINFAVLFADLQSNGYVDSSGVILAKFVNLLDFTGLVLTDPTLTPHQEEIYDIMKKEASGSLESIPERFQNCIDKCVALTNWVQDIILYDVSAIDLLPADDPSNPLLVEGPFVTATQQILNIIKRFCQCPIIMNPILHKRATEACTDRVTYFLPRSLVYRSDGTRFNPSGEMDIVKGGIFESYFDCKWHCFDGKYTCYTDWLAANLACENTYNNMIDNTCNASAVPTDCECYRDFCQDQRDNVCKPDCVTNDLNPCVASCDPTDPTCIPGCSAPGSPYDNCLNTCQTAYLTCLNQPGGYNACLSQAAVDLDACKHDPDPTVGADAAYVECRDAVRCMGNVDRDVAISLGATTYGAPEAEVSPTTGDIKWLNCFDAAGHFQINDVLDKNVLRPALGSCDETVTFDPGPVQHVATDPVTGKYILGGFLKLLQESIPEAINQKAKFEKRMEFLTMMKTDIVKAYNIFKKADDMFTAFMTCDDSDGDGIADGPLCELIRERVRDKDTGLPYQVVYGWESGQPKNRPYPNEDKPYWHIVKVEARAPQKCDARCDTNQTGAKGWPYVKTYTKNLGLTRCFKIANKSGTVKFRVTRWDEDRDKERILTFPNGMPIWDFKFTNPKRNKMEEFISKNNLLNITAANDFVWTNCKAPAMIMDTGIAGHEDEYQGAFMMDELVQDSDPNLDNKSCWDMASYLLADGITSETCAQYYFAGTGHGYTFKFVPCKDF